MEDDDSNIIKKAECDLKRKQKPNDTSKHKRGKKKPPKRSRTSVDKEQNDTSSELSESDKKLLDRWKNMQTKTKPFIHPIRKYMEDIKTLKEQEQVLQESKVNSDNKGNDEMANTEVHYQFTNYISEKGDGDSLKAVKEPAVADHGPQVLFPQNLLGRFPGTVEMGGGLGDYYQTNSDKLCCSTAFSHLPTNSVYQQLLIFLHNFWLPTSLCTRFRGNKEG